jgi:hypothetical protein
MRCDTGTNWCYNASGMLGKGATRVRWRSLMKFWEGSICVYEGSNLSSKGLAWQRYRFKSQEGMRSLDKGFSFTWGPSDRNFAVEYPVLGEAVWKPKSSSSAHVGPAPDSGCFVWCARLRGEWEGGRDTKETYLRMGPPKPVIPALGRLRQDEPGLHRKLQPTWAMKQTLH